MKRCHLGFTLIELLVTTALVAILMAAVVMIVAGIARDQRDLGAMGAADNVDNAMSLLRWDLTNSRFLVPTSDGMVIIGHCALDRRTLLATGRPARIVYRIVRGQLMRQQQPLDEPARPEQFVELVGLGIQRLALEPASDESPLVVPPGSVPAAQVARRRGPEGGVAEVWQTPSRIHVRLERERDVVERTLWLR